MDKNMNGFYSGDTAKYKLYRTNFPAALTSEITRKRRGKVLNFGYNKRL